ncbi:hypothetical protein B5807_07203 [Epicoccum nigrum]|uniref:Uncharacterized protein n=1 Tax=Epicoccum nigrum TaxID=105696 RepID=A0A1Y2LVP0_EPING|nr:hypothetical protein B5807_07203 [Epicoccum nigrum]
MALPVWKKQDTKMNVQQISHFSRPHGNTLVRVLVGCGWPNAFNIRSESLFVVFGRYRSICLPIVFLRAFITAVTPHVLPQSLDVVVGTWPDPHKDTSIPFVRGPTLRPRGLNYRGFFG